MPLGNPQPAWRVHQKNERRKEKSLGAVQSWEYSYPGKTVTTSMEEARPVRPEGSALPGAHPSTFDTKAKHVSRLDARMCASDLHAHVYGQDRSHPVHVCSPVYLASDGRVYVFKQPWRQAGKQLHPCISVFYNTQAILDDEDEILVKCFADYGTAATFIALENAFPPRVHFRADDGDGLEDMGDEAQREGRCESAEGGEGEGRGANLRK
jgi:hypothetical protein